MSDDGNPTPPTPDAPVEAPHLVSRRKALGLAGLGLAAGAGAMGIGVAAADSNTAAAPIGTGSNVGNRYPFFGPHQGGIVTPAQDRLHFAAFDVTTQDRDELISLLKRWTNASASLCDGRPVGELGAVDGPAAAPPDDTGEALDLPPSGLTLTFGFGPTLFTNPDGSPRLDLAGRRPEALIDLPHFPGDKLDPARSGGDICVQACADDPQVAVHAIRNLARLGFGTTAVKWSQLGFGRTSSTSTSQTTPRNLFGFKDGTANLKAEDGSEIDDQVWVHPDDDAAMAGGSYLVVRRINMHIEIWDRTSLGEQELLVGRQKGSGAPLSGGGEFTELDLEISGRDDQPLVPLDSHVRLAHPSVNGGVKMLRRGYNFTDGSNGLGRLDAGLFFIAYVRDPASQFVPMQNRLASQDRMSIEYLQHTGSAIFAVPPGVPDAGRWIGESLLG